MRKRERDLRGERLAGAAKSGRQHHEGTHTALQRPVHMTKLQSEREEVASVALMMREGAMLHVS